MEKTYFALIVIIQHRVYHFSWTSLTCHQCNRNVLKDQNGGYHQIRVSLAKE